MLLPALVREQELKVRFLERIQQPDTHFYYFQTYCDYELSLDRNDWKRIQFVSVSRKNELLAYFEARLNRESLVVEDVLLLSLGPRGLNFEAAGDVFRFLAYLFEDRGFRKIFFRFIKNNPAARQYDRFLRQIAHCGTVQGVLTDYTTLTDGKTYDLVIMEIRKQPYLEWFGGRYAVHPSA